MQLCVQWDVRRSYSFSLILKFWARLEDNMLNCLLASSTAVVRGRGQSELPAHVKVEAIVMGSKLEKDNLFLSVEAMVLVVILCSRLAG